MLISLLDRWGGSLSRADACDFYQQRISDDRVLELEAVTDQLLHFFGLTDRKLRRLETARSSANLIKPPQRKMLKPSLIVNPLVHPTVLPSDELS